MFKFPLALSRTVLCSIAALAFIVVSAGVVRAGGPGVAPVLVPYTITAIAGNTQSSIAGYRGNGVAALNATLSGPSAIAVDSVGNVYFSDQSNALIREINAQTGIIQNIAGQAPTSCTGTLCTVSHPGCSDGVQAVGNQVGSRIDGIAVDGYGNVYFVDYNYQGAWVIFKGGAQVANFISLVDNATAPTPASVLPGYIYHIAGVAVPKAGGGCTATSGATNDNVPANTVLFHNPIGMGLDGQGNIYIQDFANGVVRVLNAQATTQTFFGVSVKPGYVASIVGCNKTYSVPCPSAVPPFGSPAGGALFSNAQESMTVDQYGNVYELDTKGATGSIYGGVAYAGGAALAHLINLESGLTATPGGWYQVINSITSLNAPTVGPQAVYANAINDLVLRPASEVVDNNGNIYMMDLHWIAIYRVDVNNMMATKLNTTPGLTIVGGTTAAPQPCAPGSIYNSTDAYGDGCPAQLSKFNSAGTGYMAFDGAGNLYVTDTGNNIVRKISVGTQFPTINTGAAVTQTVQVHFDPSNLPAVTGTSPFSTTGFKITAGANDFAVSSVSCSNYTTGIDNSLECYANVTFTPTAPGSRKGTLLVTTASGSTYPFALTGFGNGPQIAVDGGTPSKLALTGLGKATAVAHDAAGNVYIADPTNNRVVVTPAGGGAQTTVGTGLSAPQGVAVDPAGDVYISDTGNNRVVEVLALGGGQTVLTTNVSKPLGLALDTTGNLYIADNGNRRIVEISPFGSLGTAPLLSYTGSQSLVSPVGIAIDKNGNLYVADSGNSTGLIKILAGGGDLQVAPGSTSLNPQTSIVSFGTAFVTAPSGVAIDAAGNLYVADGTSNSVQVVPSASGPGSEPFALNLPGLSGPGGLDLDSAGNVYVADTGNSRVLIDNRSNVAVNFGLQAQFQPPATIPLTITNIGTTSLTPAAPFSKLSGATADFSERDTCAASNFSIGVLVSGLHCSETISFLPIRSGPWRCLRAVR